MEEYSKNLPPAQEEIDMQMEYIAMMQSESKTPQASYVETLEAEKKYMAEQIEAMRESINEKKAMLDTAHRLLSLTMSEVVELKRGIALRDEYIAGIKQLIPVTTRHAFFDKAHVPRGFKRGEWGAIDA